MDKGMEDRIRKQLKLRNEGNLYCTHDSEKPCAECMSGITGDVSDIYGNVSDISGNVSDIYGDVSDIMEILKSKEPKEKKVDDL
jgi:hypothetical protein